jgi:carbon starvation protein
MNILHVFILTIIAIVIAGKQYSGYISRHLGEKPERLTPALSRKDGRDYVPSKLHVLFAHHFSTIAGAGPIIGPALGVLYGFVPAWAWVVFGSIFIGAVHDYTSLFASMREGGNSMAQIAGKSLGRWGFNLFILFTLILILLVTAAFLKLSAVSLTSMWPLEKLGLDQSQTLLRTVEEDGQVKGVIGGIASTSVIVVTLIAPILGTLLFRRRINTAGAYLFALLLCLAGIYTGFQVPVSLSPDTWMLVISGYVLFAATLPVWVILQPRDFVNAQILYAGMILLIGAIFIVGIFGSEGALIRMPNFNLSIGIEKMGFIWPMLFITIACGAISGFHAMVSGGTTAKQVSSEKDARRIGYGGMLLEGLLATMVLLAIGSSLSLDQYLGIVWPDDGASNPILAFSLAAGILVNKAFPFISVAVGSVFGILMIESFIITTLDSAVRLNRYLFEELWRQLFRSRVPPLLTKYYFNAPLAVGLMWILAYTNTFTLIWPIFGTANQLLAALTLLVVSSWLALRDRKNWFTLIPAGIMLLTTIASLIYLLYNKYLPAKNYLLVCTDLLLLLLSVGMLLLVFRGRRALSPAGK